MSDAVAFFAEAMTAAWAEGWSATASTRARSGTARIVDFFMEFQMGGWISVEAMGDERNAALTASVHGLFSGR